MMHLLALLLSLLEKKNREEKVSLLKQALIHPPAHTQQRGDISAYSVCQDLFFLLNLFKLTI